MRLRYKKHELLETSLVSVPANANALQQARALNISDETISLAFGASADRAGNVVSRSTGKSAVTSPNSRIHSMTISEQIQAMEQRVVAHRDTVTDLASKVAEDANDDLVAALDNENQALEKVERTLGILRATEQRLAAAAQPVTSVVTREASDTRRAFAVPAVKVKPEDLIVRSLVAKLHSHAVRGERSPADILAMRYGDDGKVSDEQRTVFDVVTRAASAPATTTTSGWASQLVETAFAGFMELLLPASVYPGLRNRSLQLNLGRAGTISVPTRASTPTVAGSFVAEGAAIPVRQAAFSAQTFGLKKLGVITTFTREIAEHSNPAIEGLLRNAIQEDTASTLDSVLLDATAASSIRPAGLRNGVTVTTATAGGGFAALVGDLKALVTALITATSGNIRQPVWIMNPVNALSIALTQNAGGDFPFAQEINGGTFQGYPVIQSASVTAGMVILMDAADFVTLEGGGPMFSVSDQATLHMEDTTPTAIGTAGTPNVVAAPVRSLFQTDSMALRMIMDVNWGLRRTGVVAWTQAVTW